MHPHFLEYVALAVVLGGLFTVSAEVLLSHGLFGSSEPVDTDELLARFAHTS